LELVKLLSIINFQEYLNHLFSKIAAYYEKSECSIFELCSRYFLINIYVFYYISKIFKSYENANSVKNVYFIKKSGSNFFTMHPHDQFYYKAKEIFYQNSKSARGFFIENNIELGENPKPLPQAHLNNYIAYNSGRNSYSRDPVAQRFDSAKLRYNNQESNISRASPNTNQGFLDSNTNQGLLSLGKRQAPKLEKPSNQNYHALFTKASGGGKTNP
jgi:hypothetical protein